VIIEKERIEKSLFGAETDIDNIFPSINKPCEEVLKEIEDVVIEHHKPSNHSFLTFL